LCSSEIFSYWPRNILSKGRTPIGYLNKYLTRNGHHTALQEIESNEVAFFDQEIDLALINYDHFMAEFKPDTVADCIKEARQNKFKHKYALSKKDKNENDHPIVDLTIQLMAKHQMRLADIKNFLVSEGFIELKNILVSQKVKEVLLRHHNELIKDGGYGYFNSIYNRHEIIKAFRAEGFKSTDDHTWPDEYFACVKKIKQDALPPPPQGSS